MEPRTDKPARTATVAAPRRRVSGASHTISIALAGSGGSGVMTAGTLLVDAAAKAGWYGLMVRTSGPQIRGGEAAALVRLGRRPVDTLDDAFDVLLAIDWQNVNRFADEIPLTADSVVIGDADEGDPPDVFTKGGARQFAVPLKKTAKAIKGSWTNMVALGVAGALAGIPVEALESALRESWKRDAALLDANLQALARGIAAGRNIDGVRGIPAGSSGNGKRWLITGNEAAGSARSAAACVSSPPIRSLLRPSCSNGWRPRSPRSAVLCCRPRTSSPRST